MGNPKILNLDELQLEDENAVTVVHDGKEHKMRVLDVDMFIRQQRRQQEQEKRIASGQDTEEVGFVDAVELIKESVSDFFPTLDVGNLPTPKLFRIFAFLNEIASKVNFEGADPVVSEDESEGNEVSEEVTES